MRLVKKINSSAVLCVGVDGCQLVAMGNGIGFLNIGDEVPMSRITRTFYDVDPLYLGMLSELPEDVLELASQVVDASMGLLSYELSPNIAFILADHIAFAIKRSREGIVVRMPLSYDLKQQYPVEYRIGLWAVKRINKQFDVLLPPQEAVGIALGFINNMAMDKEGAGTSDEDVLAGIIEEATAIVEDDLNVQVDREGISYARFATHIQYLFLRILAGERIESGNESMYGSVCAEYPEVSACTDRIAAVFARQMGQRLTDEEKLYLMLHVNRIAATATG